jgi:hypothetical protein
MAEAQVGGHVSPVEPGRVRIDVLSSEVIALRPPFGRQRVGRRLEPGVGPRVGDIGHIHPFDDDALIALRNTRRHRYAARGIRGVYADAQRREDAPVPWNGDDYQRRLDTLTASGAAVHGEADFVMGFHPATVLDAGCGTGRVAIELFHRGVAVTGADIDASMIATASRLGPSLIWVEAALGQLELDPVFDVVVVSCDRKKENKIVCSPLKVDLCSRCPAQRLLHRKRNQ